VRRLLEDGQAGVECSIVKELDSNAGGEVGIERGQLMMRCPELT